MQVILMTVCVTIISLIILLAILVLIFYCKEESIFYRPKRFKYSRTTAVSPDAGLPSDRDIVLKDAESGAYVTFQALAIETEDGLTLRGMRLNYCRKEFNDIET